MSLENRRKALEERHAQTDADLHTELTRPSADPTRVNSLRREKLRLKDELQNIHAATG